jgi:hypothetical protein
MKELRQLMMQRHADSFHWYLKPHQIPGQNLSVQDLKVGSPGACYYRNSDSDFDSDSSLNLKYYYSLPQQLAW